MARKGTKRASRKGTTKKAVKRGLAKLSKKQQAHFLALIKGELPDESE